MASPPEEQTRTCSEDSDASVPPQGPQSEDPDGSDDPEVSRLADEGWEDLLKLYDLLKLPDSTANGSKTIATIFKSRFFDDVFPPHQSGDGWSFIASYMRDQMAEKSREQSFVKFALELLGAKIPNLEIIADDQTMMDLAVAKDLERRLVSSKKE